MAFFLKLATCKKYTANFYENWCLYKNPYIFNIYAFLHIFCIFKKVCFDIFAFPFLYHLGVRWSTIERRGNENNMCWVLSNWMFILFRHFYILIEETRFRIRNTFQFFKNYINAPKTFHMRFQVFQFPKRFRNAKLSPACVSVLHWWYMYNFLSIIHNLIHNYSVVSKL